MKSISIYKSLIRVTRLLFPLMAVLSSLLSGSPELSLAVQVERRSTLNWGELHDRVHNLNPLINGTNEERSIKRLIYGEPLFSYNPTDVRIDNGIVERFLGPYPNLNSWVLTLRPGITFQDGTPLRPEDVIFSIELYREYVTRNSLSYNLQLDKLIGITDRGDDIFEIEMKEPIDNFQLIFADIPILSRAYYQGNDYDQTISNITKKRPFGYGPFRITSFIPGRTILLERHSGFYGKLPEFEQIIVSLYESSDQMKSDFIKGDLDFTQVYEANDREEIFRADTTFVIVSDPTQFMTMFTVSFNYADPLLSSKSTREALNKVFNKQRYPLSNLRFDVRSVARGPLPESSWAYFEELKPPKWDPINAKRELERIGWRISEVDGINELNGKTFEMELIYPEREKYLESLVQHIRLNLGEIGVSVTVNPLSDEEHTRRIMQKDYQLALDFYTYYPMDIVRTFYSYFNYSNATLRRNNVGTSDAEAIRQLRRAAIEPNPRNAKAIFHRLQDFYRNAFTTNVLTYRHRRVFAISNRRITNYLLDNRLLPIAQWRPYNNP